MEIPGAIVPESRDALLVLERMGEGFYAIDTDWQFSIVNRSAEDFWGLKRDYMLGKSMFTLFKQFRGSPSHHAHLQAFETGVPVHVETISAATGAPVALRLFPSEAGLSCYFSDITRRRELEEDLRSRNELLTLAEVSAGVGVWMADLSNGTLVATPQFFRLLGIEPMSGPVSVDLPRQFRHPEDRERVTEGFRESLERGMDTYECPSSEDLAQMGARISGVRASSWG